MPSTRGIPLWARGRPPVSETQAGFAGGLCQITSQAVAWPGPASAVLRPDQALQLTNLRLGVTGQATKRLGTQQTTSSALAGAAMSGIHWPAQNQIVLACGGAGLLSGDASAGLPSSYSSIASSTATGTPVFAIFSNGSTETLYVADGTLQKWSGAARAAIGGAPAVTGICVYNSRLWGWISGQSNALYFSDLSTTVGSIGGDSLGVTTAGGGQINVVTFGKANIIACFPLGASLIICHDLGVSRLTGFGQDDITVTPQAISPEVGLVGAQAWCTYGNVAYVSTVQGLWALTEGSAQRVGTTQFPDPTMLPVTSAYNAGNASRTQCTYNRLTNEVWLNVQSSAGSQYGTYVYHAIVGAWAGPWTGVFNAMNGFVDYLGFSNAGSSGLFPQVLVLSTDAYVLTTEYQGALKDEIHSDATGGTSYTTTLQCHRYYGGSRPFSKAWRQVDITATFDAGAAAPTLQYTTELGGTSSIALVMPSNPATTQNYNVQVGGDGPWIDLLLTESGHNAVSYEVVAASGFLLNRR